MNSLQIAFVVIVFALHTSLSAGQNDKENTYVNVPLSTLVKKFIVADQATSFSIGGHDGTGNVLAAFDKDGQLRVTIRRGRGGKTFKTGLELIESPRLLVADLDGDSKAEVLVCSDKLRVCRIEEDALKLVWTSPETFDASPPPRLGLSDFDGDGHTDIAVLNYMPETTSETKSLYLYQNLQMEAQFSLSGSATMTDEHGYHSFSGLAIGDFSGNERDDIVVGNDNGWMWLLEVKNGKPTVGKSWKVESGGAIGPGLCAANMVAGSKEEILVGTNGGDIFVYGFQPNGDPEVIAKASAGRLAYGVQAGDMDGDGLDEFLLARGSLGYARMTAKDVVTEIWKLNGDGLSNVWRKEATGFVTPRLILQDLDGDGTSELVTYSPFGKGKAIEAVKPVFNR